MTITSESEALGQALLALIDALVTHRVEVVTDSDWFIELVTQIVNEIKETN